MRIKVFIRPETLILLLMRRGWTQERLARELKVTGTYISLIIGLKYSPSARLQSRLMSVFRGVSHKPGGRLTWDDMFSVKEIDSNSTHEVGR